MNNRWFTIDDIDVFDGKTFSCFTSINQSYVKYDVLEMKFKIGCCLQWFAYNWRRRTSENISYMYAQPHIDVEMDEIFEIPLFKTIEEPIAIKKAEFISRMIQENAYIKKSMIEKYMSKFKGCIYTNSKISINTLYERFCDIEDIKTKKILGHGVGNINDDFIELKDEMQVYIIDSY